MEMDPLDEVQTKCEVVEPMNDLIVPMKIEADHDAFENFMSSFQENSTKTKDKRKDFDNYCNIDIGTENLIQVMERHPGLWDPRHLDYPNKQKRDTEWLKVADELFPNWNFLNETQDVLREVKKRWRNTRDSYKKDKVNRDHADDPAKRKRRRYIFSKQLSFLDPVLQFKEFNRSSNANMMSNMMSGFEDGPQFIVDKYDLDYSPKREPNYSGVDDIPSTSSFVTPTASTEFDQSLPLMSSSGQHSNSRPRSHKRNHSDRNLQEFNHFLSARKKSRSMKTNNNNSNNNGGGGGGGSGSGNGNAIVMNSGGVVGSSHHNLINNNNSASSQNSMNCSSSSSNKGNGNISQNNNQNSFAGSQIQTANNNSSGNMWKSVREDDEDRYFLLSLLNDIKKVPEHRKLQLKTELLLSIQKYQNLDSESMNSGNLTYLNGFEFEQNMRESYSSSNSESSESMFTGDQDEQ